MRKIREKRNDIKSFAIGVAMKEPNTSGRPLYEPLNGANFILVEVSMMGSVWEYR